MVTRRCIRQSGAVADVEPKPLKRDVSQIAPPIWLVAWFSGSLTLGPPCLSEVRQRLD